MAARSAQAEVEERGQECASFELLLNALPLPITIKPACPLDDQQLLEFCEANDGFEIECDADGSITIMSPARAQTSRLNQLLNVELAIWARQNGGIVFGPDLGIRFPDRVMRGPDCAWLSASRWNGLAPEDRDSFLHACPEFVAELRSSTDRASRIASKMEFWVSRGVELGWMIDPRRKLAMVYRAGREAEILLTPEWLEGEGPLSGFRLRMDEFWK